MALTKVYPLRFARRGYNIVVVGAGGTGGYLLNYLAKSVALINASRQKNHHCITIVDGDTVETKNITRQNFIMADVDRNKAEVLAERYGNAYGIEILYVPRLVTTKTKLKQIFNYARDRMQEKGANVATTNRYGRRNTWYGAQEVLTPMLVGCVDSNRARANVFHEWFADQDDAIWVDCGNEKTNGQTVIGVRTPYPSNVWDTPESLDTALRNYKDLMKRGQQHMARMMFNTPAVTQLHPDLLDKAKTEEAEENRLSCADVAVVDPQTMRANLHAAMVAYDYIDDLLYSREVNSHAMYFSTNGSTTPKLNTYDALVEYNRNR